jgi:hypothetical protein
VYEAIMKNVLKNSGANFFTCTSENYMFAHKVLKEKDILYGMCIQKKVLSVVSIKIAFFFKWRQKICLNLLIKKKRDAQLINGKPGENRYKKTTSEKPDTCNFLTNETNQQPPKTYNNQIDNI